MREGNWAQASGAGLLGDVIVSVPTARRQARARGGSVLSEVTMLVAHGLLTCSGGTTPRPLEGQVDARRDRRLCSGAPKQPCLNSPPRPGGDKGRVAPPTP